MLDELHEEFVFAEEVVEPGEVARAAKRHAADIVLYDEDTVGERDMLASVSEIAADPRRSAKAVVLLALPERRPWLDYLGCGARGLLFRDSSADELGFAIRAVTRGGVYLTPELAGTIVRTLMRRRPAPVAMGRAGQLTIRQHEILDLLVTGVSNAEIAACLSLSEKTVKFHVSNILGKLNLKNRTQVLAYLMGSGRAPG